MKKLLSTLAVLLCATVAMAQQDMYIGKLFDGRFRHNAAVTETHIKGPKLESYNLNEYHSLTFSDRSNTALVEQLVLRDARTAYMKETSYVGGQLYFGFYAFTYNSEIYRYIFYLNNQLKGKDTVTLIYMDGSAEPDKVKKMLKK